MFSLINDVSKPNQEVVAKFGLDQTIGAVTWSEASGDSIHNARISCLHHAVRELLAGNREWELWFVGGHRIVQPDNRITRYRGFWGSIPLENFSLAAGELESIVDSDSGFRGFGAMKFGLQQLEGIHGLLLHTQGCICFLPPDIGTHIVQQVVENGWLGENSKPPSQIVEAVCLANGMVIDVYGSHDDPDVLVAAFGKPNILEKWVIDTRDLDAI